MLRCRLRLNYIVSAHGFEDGFGLSFTPTKSFAEGKTTRNRSRRTI
jgi:hypothetical protein